MSEVDWDSLCGEAGTGDPAVCELYAVSKRKFDCEDEICIFRGIQAVDLQCRCTSHPSTGHSTGSPQLLASFMKGFRWILSAILPK